MCVTDRYERSRICVSLTDVCYAAGEDGSMCVCVCVCVCATCVCTSVYCMCVCVLKFNVWVYKRTGACVLKCLF